MRAVQARNLEEEQPDCLIIPARKENFVARERIIFGNHRYQGRNDNFHDYFLAGGGKVERACSEKFLQEEKLFRPYRPLELLKEFGGEEKVAVTLAEIDFLIVNKKLPHDSFSHSVFFVRDQNEILRLVLVNQPSSRSYLQAYPEEVDCGKSGLLNKTFFFRF